MYTIYALTEPKGDETTWRDVRYIGMSTNVQSRYGQHVACSDASHEDKNAWVRGLLERGTCPALHQIETVQTAEEARAREQYWIRYCMAQKADLFNRAIVYVGDERIRAQEERAIRNAKIKKILQSGTFVRQADCWYPSSVYPAIHGNVSTPLRDRIQRVSIKEMVEGRFLNEQGEPQSLEGASDEEFDAFIKKYISVMDFGNNKWGWEDRIGAINYAKSRGLSPEFGLLPDPPAKTRQQVRSTWRVIRPGDRNDDPPDSIA